MYQYHWLKKIDPIATRMKRSRGWILKQALSAWVDQEEERRRMTLEGMADIEAGQVIEHQTVLVWAESLSTNTPLSVPR